MDQNNQYEVVVLFNGYSCNTEGGSQSNCTCTLIKGPKNIIVDTMTAWDGNRLQNALEEQGLKCSDIDYVVCTHGHSDHIGCNYLFQCAMHIVGFCISKNHYYFDFDFSTGKPYFIDQKVRVIPTPGHTMQDVSVIVSTNKGSYGITGDLFENKDDEDIWHTLGVDNAELQAKHRNEMLKYVDFIVPGHGPMFEARYIWDKRK
ncbi:Metallo-beta-lactamase superfamily [Popillia japonica]|uniref:Metallo-beta-lactamase domain-containing protein 1 n=1 Tax=Popillia japonica TaxID=7064 RepID=A0AAW1LY05_POPJA